MQKKLKLDTEKFKTDIKSEAVQNSIDKDVQSATSLNISATPTVFLNGKQLGFIEIFELEKLLAKDLSKKKEEK